MFSVSQTWGIDWLADAWMDGHVCLGVSPPHLHIGSPQGHTVSRQPQNDDYDVERGLEKQVHLTVHITEWDVAHGPAWNTLLCFWLRYVFSYSQLWLPLFSFSRNMFRQFDSDMSTLVSSATTLLSNIEQQKKTELSFPGHLIVPFENTVLQIQGRWFIIILSHASKPAPASLSTKEKGRSEGENALKWNLPYRWSARAAAPGQGLINLLEFIRLWLCACVWRTRWHVKLLWDTHTETQVLLNVVSPIWSQQITIYSGVLTICKR